MLLLISQEPLSDLLPHSDRVSGLEMRRYHTEAEAFALHLSGEFGRQDPIRISGAFAAIQHPEYKLVWFVLTDATNDFLKRPFRRFLKRIHPQPISPILKTGEIQDLLITLSTHPLVSDMRVVQLGYRGRISSIGATRAIERDRKWTDLTISEAFEDVLTAGQWVVDASADYRYSDNKTARITIGRQANMRFVRQFKIPADAVLTKVARLASGWYHFLRDRQRAPETHFRSRPFLISFRDPVLATHDQIEALATALRRIPAASFTVIHGNPYYHAVLVDYRDGSTNEVLILDESAIYVLPQGRSTVRSLRTLCSRVFADFREGVLQEVPGE
ncbi:MAG: hypothetical protein ACRENP_03270 [Longimicrobiales bacterium]